MVWLAKWIREHQPDSRVLLINDRTELDDQIEQVFKERSTAPGAAERCSTPLDKSTEWLIFSLIHKFRGSDDDKDQAEADGEFVKERQTKIPKRFAAKGKIFVFVDEAYHTQSGNMHDAMKRLLS
jgi:type I restriction enzyme R subunit